MENQIKYMQMEIVKIETEADPNQAEAPNDGESHSLRIFIAEQDHRDRINRHFKKVKVQVTNLLPNDVEKAYLQSVSHLEASNDPKVEVKVFEGSNIRNLNVEGKLGAIERIGNYNYHNHLRFINRDFYFPASMPVIFKEGEEQVATLTNNAPLHLKGSNDRPIGELVVMSRSAQIHDEQLYFISSDHKLVLVRDLLKAKPTETIIRYDVGDFLVRENGDILLLFNTGLLKCEEKSLDLINELPKWHKEPQTQCTTTLKQLELKNLIIVTGYAKFFNERHLFIISVQEGTKTFKVTGVVTMEADLADNNDMISHIGVASWKKCIVLLCSRYPGKIEVVGVNAYDRKKQLQVLEQVDIFKATAERSQIYMLVKKNDENIFFIGGSRFVKKLSFSLS